MLQVGLVPPPGDPAVVKWVARVRSGCLATQARRLRCRWVDSALCPCCADAEEDDRHLLAACPATGSSDWPTALPALWQSVADACRLAVPPPPVAWLEQHHLPLTAALIPVSNLWHHPLPSMDALRFLRRQHVALAERLAELLSRRYTLVLTDATAEPAQSSGAPAVPRLRRPCPLPASRQPTVPTLRQWEIAERAAPRPTPGPALTPPHGEARRLWLRARLDQLLRHEMVACPAASGCSAVAILALFESTTGEPFTASPGTPVKDRVSAIARVLSNLLAEGPPLQPPLTRIQRQGTFYYSRAPPSPLDADRWRRSTQAREAAHPVAALHQRMASADATFVLWI